MAGKDFLFTSESVSEGHPDKFAIKSRMRFSTPI